MVLPIDMKELLCGVWGAVYTRDLRVREIRTRQAVNVGFRTSVHHCRKLVGVCVSDDLVTALSRPSSFACIMST